MAIRAPIADVGKQAAIYGVGNVFTKLAAFLLIPIYTRYMSMTEVGILALLEMVEMFLITLIPFGMFNALWRHLPKAKESEKKTIIISGYLGTFLMNLVVLGVISLFFQSSGKFLGLTSTNANLFLVVLLNILLAYSIRFLLALLQYEGKAVSYVIVSVMQFLGVLAATIYLVVQKDLGLAGAVWGKTIPYGILALCCTIVVLRRYAVLPSFKAFNTLFKFGAPLIVLALVPPVLKLADRFFLNYYVSLEDIGIYSIAYKFGMIINMFLIMPLQKSWLPMMYKIGVEEEAHTYHRDLLFYYGVVGGAFFLAIAFFHRELIQLAATSDYLKFAFVVPLITFAYYLNGFRQFFVAGASLKDKTPRLAAASAVTIGMSLLLNFALIRLYGVSGAAWASLGSYAVLVILIYAASQRVARIDWYWWRLMKLAIVLAVSFGGVTYLNTIYSNQTWLWNLTGLIVYIVLLKLTGAVGKRELSGIRYLFSQVVNSIKLKSNE